MTGHARGTATGPMGKDQDEEQGVMSGTGYYTHGDCRKHEIGRAHV